MKNKKGFTLIELLAVIVVLAIIALIATPIVMNTIKNAKKGAAERTADNYIKQVETTIAEKKLENNPLADGPYTIDSNGNLTGNGLTESVTIDMSGNKPTSGTVTISNGEVLQIGTTMTVGDYDVKYNQEKNKYEASEKGIVVYRCSTDKISIGDIIDPSDTSKFTKDPNTLGESKYLKHVLDKENKVTESYVCVIFNSKEYCLKGADPSFYGWSKNETDYTKNVLTIKKWSDVTDGECDVNTDRNFECLAGSGPSGRFYASSDGAVGFASIPECYIETDGSSTCYNFY